MKRIIEIEIKAFRELIETTFTDDALIEEYTAKLKTRELVPMYQVRHRLACAILVGRNKDDDIVFMFDVHRGRQLNLLFFPTEMLLTVMAIAGNPRLGKLQGTLEYSRIGDCFRGNYTWVFPKPLDP
jgi:hypothetical protein